VYTTCAHGPLAHVEGTGQDLNESRSLGSGPARADLNCPNCGAALKINAAGVCEYCSGKITSGDFDWVLSKIEQDESYAG